MARACAVGVLPPARERCGLWAQPGVGAALKDKLVDIENTIADVCEKFRDEQNQIIKNDINRIKSTYCWLQLNDETKQEYSNRLDAIAISDKAGLEGIRQIINEMFGVNTQLRNIEREIEEAARTKPTEASDGKRIKKHSLSHLSKRIEKKEDVDKIISEFDTIKTKLQDDEIVELNW